MRKLLLLTKMLLVSAMLFAATSAWAQVSVPEAVYFNDFSSTAGLEIIGNGEFMTDADPAFGKVFHNDPANTSAIRTNYLKLPADVLSHSATSKEMTIGFWVNKKGEDSFFFTPLFAAYGAAPSGGTNAAPMFVCETRGLIQLNCDGWCDFGINGGGTEFNDGTPYVNTVWLDDGAWHYYTITLTEKKAKVYVDGELKNGWTVDGTSNGQKISGLFTSGSSLSYVTLGGNQAWDWGDPDPAFAFDDFAVYDQALSAEQIAKIISDKGKAASTYNITYDFKNFVAEGATSGNLSKGSNPAVGETNNTRSVYYPTTYVEGFCGRIAMNFSSERWSISNTGNDNDKGLIWNQGADEYFSILGLKAGDKVTINTTSGTIYFSTKGNCTGTYYCGTNYVDTGTGIPAQWNQLVSGNTYTILADGQLNLQAKRNNGAAGRAQTKEKLVISSIVIIPSQAETVSAPTISSEGTVGGCNVTITSGTSDMLSGVSTYYTIDGTTPTSSSTKYTIPFFLSTTATVKAITISNSSAATPSAVTEQSIDVYSYTVKAIDGSSKVLNDNLASGSVGKGGTVNVTYPRWILSGTTLYACGSGSVAYNTSFTPNANNYIKNITYNSGTVNNVVFYTEAEDVAGVSVGTNDNRASKKQMGHTGGANNYKQATTLSPGKYIIYMRGQNGNAAARAFNFKVGDNVVFTGSIANGTNRDINSDEFSVDETSALSFASEGSGQSGIDYFYVVKTSDVVTISAVGWATYCSKYPLDFTGVTALTAYTASVDGTTVKFNKVSGKVPANTGLLISGETANVPVCSSADPVANILKGVTTATVKDAGTIYVLKKGTNGLGFYKNANDFTVRANSAYIPAASIGATARGFISLDDEATGIKGSLTPTLSEGESLTPALSEGEGVFYNLNGCKIAQPTKKGVYVVNGKKVVIK